MSSYSFLSDLLPVRGSGDILKVHKPWRACSIHTGMLGGEHRVEASTLTLYLQP